MAKKSQLQPQEQSSAPKRTIEQITQEYQVACAHVGDKEFRIKKLHGELTELYKKISDLDKEAAEVAHVQSTM